MSPRMIVPIAAALLLATACGSSTPSATRLDVEKQLASTLLGEL